MTQRPGPRWRRLHGVRACRDRPICSFCSGRRLRICSIVSPLGHHPDALRPRAAPAGGRRHNVSCSTEGEANAHLCSTRRLRRRGPFLPESADRRGYGYRGFRRLHGQGPDDDPTDPDGVKPRLVTSWTQFENLYGGYAEGCMLPIAVRGYFDNGGTIAYIVRIPNTSPSGEPSQLALPAADKALGTPLDDDERRARRQDLHRRSRTPTSAPTHDGPNPFNLSGGRRRPDRSRASRT